MQKNGLLFFIFRRFGVKESRHSETTFAKKKYTSVVANIIPTLVPCFSRHPRMRNVVHPFGAVPVRA